MRLGLNLGYLVGADDPRGQLRLTQHAESLGFERGLGGRGVRVGQPDRAGLAGRRRPATIDVGSAVMQIPARTPAMTAMTAASLDVLTGGRFRLGLGRLRPAGVGGLARRPVRPAAGPDPGVRRRSSSRPWPGRR